ncbi:hypothetical protein INP23_14730, partial [Staphylococcus aureus]|nr:hypothetical protein [Staphylococcus aureus]
PICTVKNMAPKMIPIINAIGKVVPSLILRSGELIIVNTVRQILLRATKISILFAVAFFIINYIGMEKPDILYLVGRTIIATL